MRMFSASVAISSAAFAVFATATALSLVSGFSERRFGIGLWPKSIGSDSDFFDNYTSA